MSAESFFVLLSPSGRILRVEPSCLCYWGLHGGHAGREKRYQGGEVRRTEIRGPFPCGGLLTEPTPPSSGQASFLSYCAFTCRMSALRVSGVVAIEMTSGTNNMGS